MRGAMPRPRTDPPNLARLAGIMHDLAEVRQTVDRLEHEVIQLVRDTSGATWEAIGDELGIARQTAEKRFKRAKRRRPGQT